MNSKNKSPLYLKYWQSFDQGVLRPRFRFNWWQRLGAAIIGSFLLGSGALQVAAFVNSFAQLRAEGYRDALAKIGFLIFPLAMLLIGAVAVTNAILVRKDDPKQQRRFGSTRQ